MPSPFGALAKTPDLTQAPDPEPQHDTDQPHTSLFGSSDIDDAREHHPERFNTRLSNTTFRLSSTPPLSGLSTHSHEGCVLRLPGRAEDYRVLRSIRGNHVLILHTASEQGRVFSGVTEVIFTSTRAL